MRSVIALLLVVVPAQAGAWSLGYVGKNNGDKARIACGLIERFGPNRTETDLDIEIANSPYGRLTVTMGVFTHTTINKTQQTNTFDVRQLSQVIGKLQDSCAWTQ